VVPLLFYGALRSRHSLEPRVRNWFAAFDRQTVCAGCQPRLGTFNSPKLYAEILGSSGIELILIEVLGIPIAGLDAIGRLERTASLKSDERLLDACALSGKQFSCALRLHARRLPGPPTAAVRA